MTQPNNFYVKWYVEKFQMLFHHHAWHGWWLLSLSCCRIHFRSAYTDSILTKPEGGVYAGEIFLAPLPNTYNAPRITAPIGYWKDDLFNVCDEGMCHPSLCCSLLCPIFALGQVMSRMQVNWLGSPCAKRRVARTFDVIIVLLLLDCVFYRFSFSSYYNNYSLTFNLGIGTFLSPVVGYVERLVLWIMDESEYASFLWYIRPFVLTTLLFWKVFATARTRRTLRERYQIREQYCCQGTEDTCVSLWCWCFTTAQMLRHTGEYENYQGVCCSSTGHQPGVPLVVWEYLPCMKSFIFKEIIEWGNESQCLMLA